MCSSDLLDPRVHDADVQIRAYNVWKNRELSHPLMKHGVYGLASEPSDGPSLVFAAHLLSLWLEKQRPSANVNVRWLSFGAGNDFKLGKDILEDEAPCDIMVISNLSVNSSKARLERVRDLIFHRTYPVIVVVAGEDPITFFSRRLFCPLQAYFFQSSKLIKRKVEVV
mgnify:FL=1